jgi:hypothetical protein
VMAAAANKNDGSTNSLQDPKVTYKILLDLFVQLWMWRAKQFFFHCWILPPQQLLIHMSNSGALLWHCAGFKALVLVAFHVVKRSAKKWGKPLYERSFGMTCFILNITWKALSLFC